MDNWCSIHSRGRDFSLQYIVQTGSRVHPDSYPIGTRSYFPGGKADGHDAGHSPPSGAKVKNTWSYTSIPSYVFMVWCIVKHRMSSWHST
jgi:hypothetical protein